MGNNCTEQKLLVNTEQCNKCEFESHGTWNDFLPTSTEYNF